MTRAPRRGGRAGSTLVLAGLVLTAAATPAGAEPGFGDVTVVPPDADVALAMSVPHEREGVHNTSVVITLPKGWDARACEERATWTCELVQSGDGATVAFTKGDGAPAAQDETFRFTLHSTADPGTYAFATRQVYDDATSVTWRGPALKVPAPEPTSSPAASPIPTGTVSIKPVPPVTAPPRTPSPSPRVPNVAQSATPVPAPDEDPAADDPVAGPGTAPQTSSPRVVVPPGAAAPSGTVVGPLARPPLPWAPVPPAAGPGASASPSPAVSDMALPDLGDGDDEVVITDVDPVAVDSDEPGFPARAGMGALAILMLGASVALLVYLRRRAAGD